MDLDAQLRWLAHVLTSRGYPLENVVDDLRTAGSLLTRRPGSAAMHALADRLATAAAALAAFPR